MILSGSYQPDQPGKNVIWVCYGRYGKIPTIIFFCTFFLRSVEVSILNFGYKNKALLL